MRSATLKLLFVLAPVSAAGAQLSGGIGPVGHASSAASTWRTSARVWGATRLESSWSSLQLEGSLFKTGDEFRFGGATGAQQLFSPGRGGMRAVTSVEFDQGGVLDTNASSLSASSSLSYRRGMNGAWAGLRADRGTTAALRMGGWRQVGDWLTLAISSTLRRGEFGRPAHFWTQHGDSILSDSGWVFVTPDREFGDSGTMRKLTWLETEARLGWTIGRVSFDGIAGWRPAIDTTRRATWFRGLATVGLSRRVSLSAGVGTAARQVPFVRTSGHYATVAVRLAPAALMRPRDTPEITPAVSSFAVERAGDHYRVRIRLPRARVVELSGDFNGWQPMRLTQELDNTWVVSLDLKPGTYRMNVRVDGEAWAPPPGTTAVDDDFNGKVGLIVVR